MSEQPAASLGEQQQQQQQQPLTVLAPVPLHQATPAPVDQVPATPAQTQQQQQQQQQQKQQQQVANIPATSSSVKLELSESDLLAVSSENGRNQLDEPGIIERSPGGRYVRFVEKLGSGAYKDVYRAYDTIEGIEVAWNQVNLAGIPKADKIRIINEVRLLEKLDHQNIISFYGSWVNREKEQVIFVTEILSSGTLKSFIKKVQVIRWNVAKRWAIQILNGLLYLHSQDPPVSHRDLKCDNIFINGTSGDLRIGDLGLSTAISKSKTLSVLGTPEFMAPELYDEKYDEKVDIYAFGMCMLEIFTKEVPYSECSNPAQIYKKVTNQIEPESLSRIQSKEARDFILLCIKTDPAKRPTASELLSHNFLSPNADDAETEIVVSPRAVVLPAISECPSKSTTSQVREIVDEPSNRSTIIPQTHDGAVPVLASNNVSPPLSKIEMDSESVKAEKSNTYHEIPNSETNMKPVQVLMGWDEQGHLERKEIRENTAVMIPPITTNDTSSQYIVAAECMDEVVVDNLMKLIISIPIQNETQHVQFDFHLVEDDPIKVAREMVTELQIPEQAVLEISETISGLARDARVNQGKPIYNQQIEKSSRETTAVFHSAGHPEENLQKVAKDVILGEGRDSMAESQITESENVIGMDEAATDELRRLEGEYRKSLERAMKAYETRMENLKRSKEEKQAQHLKLLEKHEREMDEFDKRLKQAELDQSKRLDKLEQDWNIQKKDFLEAKRIESLERNDSLSVDTSSELMSLQGIPKVDGTKSSVSLLSMASASGGIGKSDLDLENIDRNET